MAVVEKIADDLCLYGDSALYNKKLIFSKMNLNSSDSENCGNSKIEQRNNSCMSQMYWSSNPCEAGPSYLSDSRVIAKDCNANSADKKCYRVKECKTKSSKLKVSASERIAD